MSLSVIIQTVKGHLENLVCLTQTIPGTVVPLVHFNGMPKRTDTEQCSRHHAATIVEILTTKHVLRQ